MTQTDHWNFFSSPSSKNYQDETGTADDQHLEFSSVPLPSLAALIENLLQSLQ